MKKSRIAIIAVVVTVVVVAFISALVFSGLLLGSLSSNGPPELKEASIALSLGGHYENESGIYYLDGTAENMGKKDARNCMFEITFFAENNQEIKTEIITVGDIPAENSKELNTTIQLPSGLEVVHYQSKQPSWD